MLLNQAMPSSGTVCFRWCFAKRRPVYRAFTCKIVSDIESSQPFEINTNLWTCLGAALVDLLYTGS